MGRLEQGDPEIARAIRAESERQARNLELTVSENLVSEAALERVLTNLGNTSVEVAMRAEVQDLTSRFPLYAERLR
jgi:glycine/serine hydroxymethyltransferase